MSQLRKALQAVLSMLANCLPNILRFGDLRSSLYLERSDINNITVSLKLRPDQACDVHVSATELQISLGAPLQSSSKLSLKVPRKQPSTS